MCVSGYRGHVELDYQKIRLSHPTEAWLSLAIHFHRLGGWRGYVVGGCRGYLVAGLTENKVKPSS